MPSQVHWLDWIAVGLVVLLTFRGFRQGLIEQLSTFLAMGLGILAGLYLHGAALALMPDFGVPELQFVASFVVVFVAVAISVSVLGRLLRSAVHALFLGGVDRILGSLFGVLVGVQILLIVTLLVSRFIPDGMVWLQQTQLAPHLLGLADRLLPLLPDHFGKFFEEQAAALTEALDLMEL